jgi:hypothetical protein
MTAIATLLRSGLAAGVAALLFATSVHAQSIVGVWKQVEIEVVGGPNAGTTSVAANNTIWIITQRFHSLNAASAPVSVRAGMPDPSDGYTAFAGTYERNGNTLTLRLMNSLNPTQTPIMTRQIAVTPTTFETRSTADDGVVTIRRYERLE